MKNSELLKKLKAGGCTLVRHGSNHDVWYSPATQKQFAVPRHKEEVKKGTVRAILRDAGLE